MQRFGDKGDEGFVCFSVDRGCGECNFYSFCVNAYYGVLSGSRVQADGQSGSVRYVACEGLGHQIVALSMRRPKMAVPTLTQVLPSSMATVKSFDIPMESWVSVGKRAMDWSRSRRSSRK